MLHCKFSGDCNSERIFKIGQYLTKLCVEHLGFTFFGPPCTRNGSHDVSCVTAEASVYRASVLNSMSGQLADFSNNSMCCACTNTYHTRSEVVLLSVVSVCVFVCLSAITSQPSVH